MSIHKISVVGCGKLGACMAATFARQGCEVVAIDSDMEKVEKINNRVAPVSEPRLQDLLNKPSKLSASSDYKAAVGTDATFFIVPTPSNADGSFSNDFVWSAVKSVALEIKNASKSGHLFVVSSTTTPGSLNSEILPMLESAMDGLPFQFCYNPEFIALGNVINGLMNPDFVLIGERDEASGERLAGFYRDFNGAAIRRMSLVSAELCKVAINAYVTMKISFANFIGMLAPKIGADTAAVLGGVGSDSRINRLYLSANGAYGGPCLPRDNRLLYYVAQKAGVEAVMALASDIINGAVKNNIVERVQQVAPARSVVLIIGVGYKPGSSITEESTGSFVAYALRALSYQVAVYDPHASLPGFDFSGNEQPSAIVHCHGEMIGSLPQNIPVITP